MNNLIRVTLVRKYGKFSRVHEQIVEGTDCGKGETRNRRGFKGFADEPEDQNATPISALHPRGTSSGGTLREKGSSVMPARGRTCAFPFARLGTATYES